MNVSSRVEADDQTVPAPVPPMSIQQTGLSASFLLDLLIKTVFRQGLERPSRMAAEMHLSQRIIDELVEDAKQKQLLYVLGQPGANMSAEMRYQLSAKGRDWALKAMEINGWTGAAPVPIDRFCEQIGAQTIRNEMLHENVLGRVFGELTLPMGLMQIMGPAINSGASILLYGPPGNGKTTIARGICTAFADQVYVPHAISVGIDVIVFFDPAVHRPVTMDLQVGGGLRRGNPFDPRYVLCKRPYVITGGELTLEKFDLARNPSTGIYEAPLQFKASGGLFVLDDFGRQRETPQAFINRLIIPLESGTDNLVMDSGRKIEVPFDDLVIFSTNYEPRSLVDEAGLRRLRHKIMIDRPDRNTFVKILLRAAVSAGVEISEEVLSHLLFDLYGSNANTRFNAFHPRFLIDQCVSICAFKNIELQITVEILDQAWQNLVAAH